MGNLKIIFFPTDWLTAWNKISLSNSESFTANQSPALSQGAPGWGTVFPLLPLFSLTSVITFNTRSLHLINHVYVPLLIFHGPLFHVHWSLFFLPFALCCPFSFFPLSQPKIPFLLTLGFLLQSTVSHASFSEHLTPFHLTLFISLHFCVPSSVCFVHLIFYHLLLFSVFIYHIFVCHILLCPKYFLRKSK